MLFQRSQPTGLQGFLAGVHLQFSWQPCLFMHLYFSLSLSFSFPPVPCRSRALPAQAHPAGRAPRQCLRRGRGRCRVCLQGLQWCPAPHPVDQARGEEWQQIRARWAALSPGFKGEASRMLPLLWSMASVRCKSEDLKLWAPFESGDVYVADEMMS